MDLTFRVSARISRPVAEAFEAVVNPDQLSRYFTTRRARAYAIALPSVGRTDRVSGQGGGLLTQHAPPVSSLRADPPSP